MTRHGLRRLVPEASPESTALLDPSRGLLEAPIRAEVFGMVRFRQHAASLAEAHQIRGVTRADRAFLPRLHENVGVLREADRYLARSARIGYHVTPAGAWLLDNFHLIDAQLTEIHDRSPASYFRHLPVLSEAHLAGLPRIYGVAWAFVAHNDSAFDPALLAAVLESYQEQRELTLGELWALPTTLRVILIENLRRLAERVAANAAAREIANCVSDRIERYAPAGLEDLLAAMQARGVRRACLLQLAQRLQDAAAAEDSRWHEWAGVAFANVAAERLEQLAEQTSYNLSVSNAVTSLRSIGEARWRGIVGHASALVHSLESSPTFCAEDGDTQDNSLYAIERMARRAGQAEPAIARTLLGLMRDSPPGALAQGTPGYWLEGDGRARLEALLGLRGRFAYGARENQRRWILAGYLVLLAIGGVGLVAWTLSTGSVAQPAWLVLAAAIAAWFPASEAVGAMANRLISESTRPRRLPRLALADGIPPEHRVVVVMPALLTSADGATALSCQLERHFLANPEANAQFALLTDCADADAAHAATDAAILAAAVAAIDGLNRSHPGAIGASARFLLLHRERSWCATETRWIGLERKRGKLEQLVAVLAGESPSPFVALGALSEPTPGTRYLLTLDSDTQLPPGRLRELVAIAAHPLNHPLVDLERRRVVAGYGILQPRVATPLPRPQDATPYHGLFAGQCGVDPYSAANSEVYQDLFGEGTFTGKGLLHVAAMHAVLAHRLPSERILSHDLVEGSFARCGAVTDVTVIEDMPIHADVAAARVHRWTRGDWQLLAILLHPRRYPIGPVNRWKMFDNLRRSLVAPLSLALVLASLMTSVIPPWSALALVATAFCGGPVIGAMAGLVPTRRRLAPVYFYRKGGADVLRALAAGVWSLALLLEQALLSGDAVVRTLWRMAISKRHLLQWTTAAAAQTLASVDLRVLMRKHGHVTAVAVGLTALLIAAGSPYPGLVAALGLVWAATPMWVWWVSRPRTAIGEDGVDAADRRYLQGIARDSWRLFEGWVNDGDHQLPPDNVQTQPYTMVAHRTSPTNIGLYLLSVACARRFGWIGSEDMVSRLELTLAAMGRLKRHRGHFLNWYDTATLAPLHPEYVSTVDSGNLCGHLLAVAEACLEIADGGATEAWTEAAIAAARARLPAGGSFFPTGGDRAGLAALLAERDPLGRMRTDPAGFAALLLAAAGDPGDAVVVIGSTTEDGAAAAVADYLAALASAARDAAPGAEPGRRGQRLREVAKTCRRIALEPEFGFLFDRGRRLLRIGFRVAEMQHDAACYDLLASESRLTSLWAIAKGDIPVAHWAALGRPGYALGSRAGLRSWAGSMFEYRMASLVLDEPHGSLLAEAGRVALQEQIAFGRSHGQPWGISECAYAARDNSLAYQYAPQGVPRLALRRVPADELVVAPYASVIAIELDAARTIDNLRWLERMGARDTLGFVEAIDFTPERQTEATYTLVATHMAHHQGMSIVALANLLLGGVARTWCMRDPRIAAVAPLLHEAPPRAISRLLEPVQREAATDRRLRNAGPVCELDPAQTRLQPTHLLSNGRYSVLVRGNGAGWSRFGAAALSRWRDDALRDAYGTFFYVRRSPAAVPLSVTFRPAPDAQARYRSVYHIDRVQFDTIWADLTVRSTLWVSPEDDIEFRQIELLNRSDVPIELDLLSCFEASLAPARADEAHPAFGNLFVLARWSPARRALFLERKARLESEPALHAVHFVAATDAAVQAVSALADRSHWLGRHRDAGHPLAAFDTSPQGGSDPAEIATGLDPVAALCTRMRLAPRGRARITVATAAADNGLALDALVDRYSHQANIARASLMSATFAAIRLRELRLNADQLAAILTLTTLAVVTIARHPAAGGGGGDAGAICDRRTLWRLSISGDHPMIVVVVGASDALPLVVSLVEALRLWSWSGVAVDLVVVNTEPNSYLMPVQHELAAARERYCAESRSRAGADSGSMYLLRDADISPDERLTLRNLAVVRIVADGRKLERHVQDLLDARAAASEPVPPSRVVLAAPLPPPLAATAGGTFHAASGEFRFEVDGRHRPARPWINVLANPSFGCQISDGGGGYTWAQNSRLNQLTAWSNDPLADPAVEWFLIEDTDTGEIHNIAAPGTGEGAGSHRVSHGQGYTVFEHDAGDIRVRATWCVDAVQSVKQVHIAITNRGAQPLRLQVVALVEWMLGGRRCDRHTVRTGFDRADAPDGSGAVVLTAEQRESAEGFGGTTAFLAAPEVRGNAVAAEWSCDRGEFFDVAGRLVIPRQFRRRCGTGLDPCAAIRVTLRVDPGATAERVFLMGHAASPAAAAGVVRIALATPSAVRLSEVRDHWNRLLGTVTVQSPDPLFDAMVNRWLLYQTVACRLWARAGFYQAGGAYGFRDQLQDAMALAITAPHLLRYQILVGAGRQFTAGDVQHWWHAPTGAGVRTHFSDDLLWLVHACVHYLEVTADATLLDEIVPFLDGPAVAPGAEDAYFVPQTSSESATVYEHCARAIDHSLAVGVHGLPLMGTGDWNDGMNRVGHGGRGESVWLAWFLCRLVADFAPVARHRGDADRAARWELAAGGWHAALQAEGWDGRWYRRAFFDDGQPLGADGNPECRIDLIAQVWSVLSAPAVDERQRQAMAAVTAHLFDADANLVRLLDPPFRHAVPSAGYIQAYPPGVRENGGQYSHAGVWAVMAYARLGDADRAFRVFRGLSPAHRWADPVQGPVYGIEPYVMAGDVYSQPPYVGRGGWSWYTGAAAWMYRAAIESICGLRLRGENVSFDPRLPSHWPEVTLTLLRSGKRHVFLLRRTATGTGPVSAGAVPLAPGAKLELAMVPTDSLHVVTGTTIDQCPAAAADAVLVPTA